MYSRLVFKKIDKTVTSANYKSGKTKKVLNIEIKISFLICLFAIHLQSFVIHTINIALYHVLIRFKTTQYIYDLLLIHSHLHRDVYPRAINLCTFPVIYKFPYQSLLLGH